MEFYTFENGLHAVSVPADERSALLTVGEPGELDSAQIPPELRPPAAMIGAHESQDCGIRVDPARITGHIRVPVRHNRPAQRFAFAWSGDRMVIADPTHFAADCIRKMQQTRAPAPESVGAFLVDLLLLLIHDDAMNIQQLETRLSDLEQAVLSDKTDGFIAQMSVLRRELNRNSRFYAQMDEFASAIQEDAPDLLTHRSMQRLGVFLRKVDRLRDEMQILREYASQISSEYQAQVDIMQNRVMKLLTIVTTIFMPLTLITGWYGMNFSGMHELDWVYGYPAIIALAAAVIAGLVIWFKRKKWF